MENDELKEKGIELNNEKLRIEERIDDLVIEREKLQNEKAEVLNAYRELHNSIDLLSNKKNSYVVTKVVKDSLCDFVKDSVYLWAVGSVMYSVATGNLNLTGAIIPGVVLSGIYNTGNAIGNSLGLLPKAKPSNMEELNKEENEKLQQLDTIKINIDLVNSQIEELTIIKSNIQRKIVDIATKLNIDLEELNTGIGMVKTYN